MTTASTGTEAKLRVLFVSFTFPPYNAVGAIRTGKTAKYLASFGHDVRVLSARDQDLGDPTLPLEIAPERVAFTRWLDPRAPVRRLRRGHPSGADAPAKAGTGARAALRLSRLVRTFAYLPDPQIGWLPFALREGAKLTRTWEPDVILASSSPVTSLLVASALSARTGAPWVADLRDLWVDNHYYAYEPWRRPLERRFERRVLGSAAALVTVSEPLAETLRARFGRPTTVVLNGFDESDYPERTRSAEHELRIVYTGNIYPGRQSPEPLFAALAELGPEGAAIRACFYGTSPGALAGLAERYGVAEQVSVEPAVSHLAALGVQRSADVLLHLLWNDPSEPGVYGAKLFEYLGARRPILAVGGMGGVADAMIRERRAGVVSADPAEIATALRGWLREKVAGGEIADSPPEVAAGVSRAEQTRVLEEVLRRTVRSAAHG